MKKPLKELLIQRWASVSRAEHVKDIILSVVAANCPEAHEEAGIVRAVFHDGSYIDFTLPEVRVDGKVI